MIKPESSFARAFQRALYLMVLLDNAAEWLNLEPELPGKTAGMLLDIRTAIGKFQRYCGNGAPVSWELIKLDLASEQLQDTMLLIDAVADLQDIEPVLKLVNEYKSTL